MKRYGHSIYNPKLTLLEAITSIENLRLAHQNAKRGKGWYKEVQEVEKDLEGHLRQLQESLLNKTYKTSEYETFTKQDGAKKRLIYKLPYFPDRICQWAIMQVIEPILMKQFVKHTYSAIPGRGIHSCLADVCHDMRSDVNGTKFCLKFDFKHYYPSINHDILKRKFRRIIKDKNVL